MVAKANIAIVKKINDPEEPNGFADTAYNSIIAIPDNTRNFSVFTW